MQLKRVSLANYRGIRKANPELGSHLTLLVCENGSGKSTILQAIAVGLGEVLTHLPGVSGIGFRRSGDIHQQAGRLAPYARIALECTDGLIWDRTLRRDRSQATTRQIPPGVGLKGLQQQLNHQILDPANEELPYALPVLVHYGVSRALLDVPLSRKGFPKEFSRVQALEQPSRPAAVSARPSPGSTPRKTKSSACNGTSGISTCACPSWRPYGGACRRCFQT